MTAADIVPDPPAPRLFIDVQHGLCNRLRAMASAAAIAQATGRELVVIWRPDAHCAARIGDLLDYDGMVIEDDIADLCRRFSGRVYNYMEIESGAVFDEPVVLEGPGAPHGDVYIRSAYTLVSPHRRFEDEQRFLRDLVPSNAVRALVAQVPAPNPVAVHIRMGTGPRYDHLPHESPHNWPPERHEELLQWRGHSQPEAFERRLDQLIEAGQADRVFLAADTEEAYRRFANRYGTRVVSLSRSLYDRSPRQLQYALADLLLLTAADRLLASTWSSFSDMAQRLTRPGRPVEQSGVDF